MQWNYIWNKVLYTLVNILRPTLGAWSHTDVHTIRGTILSTTSYHRLVRPAEKITVNVSLSLLTVNNLVSISYVAFNWLDFKLISLLNVFSAKSYNIASWGEKCPRDVWLITFFLYFNDKTLKLYLFIFPGRKNSDFVHHWLVNSGK